jgi:hypothetical protein
MKSLINLFKCVRDIIIIIGIALLLILIVFPELILKLFKWTWKDILWMNQVGTPMIISVIVIVGVVIAVLIWLIRWLTNTGD